MRGAGLIATLVLLASVLAAPGYATDTVVEPLPTGTDADYQLGGPSRPADRVGIVVRDRKARPAPGRYNICYVNGFQTQPDERRFWRKRWSLLLKKGGRPVVDEAWGEFLLDLRTKKKRARLAKIVGRWIDGCARDGFDAVEFDNLDSFTRSQGLLKRSQAVAFARLLVRRAHRSGLAAGQKNTVGLNGKRIGFDFAVAEQCGRYAECRRYAKRWGSQVVAVEYRNQDFRRACRAVAGRFPVVRRDLALEPGGVRRWCP